MRSLCESETDRRMDGWTDGQTDEQSFSRKHNITMNNPSPITKARKQIKSSVKHTANI